MRAVRCVTLAFITCLLSDAALASKLSPRGTKYEQHIAEKYGHWYDRTLADFSRELVLHFEEPVHEEITNRIFGCDDDESICGDPESEFAGPFIIAGVRWNDDPPFRLVPGSNYPFCKSTETIRVTTQPLCWGVVFRDAKKKAAAGDVPDAYNHAPLLARSHFGDLQFLHAMASQDGESAAETQRRVMMWAEFTWKVALGEYGPQINLKDVSIPGFDDFFGLSGWTVQDLLTIGNPALRRHIEDVAFGSILHTVEDSFAKGHARREQGRSTTTCVGHPAPGRILEFHSYAHQDSHKHEEGDTRVAFEQERETDKPDEVEVAEPLLDLYNAGANWETVRPYFECIFAIADGTTKASAGVEYAVDSK